MKRIVLIAIVLFACTATGVLAAQSDNYHGIAVQDFALALQEFDVTAPKPGSSEFVKVSASGGISPRYLLAPAMQAGWDVTFDGQGVKDGALLIFTNTEKDISVIAIAQKNTEELRLKYYYHGEVIDKTYATIAIAEEKLGCSLIGTINSSKHTTKWGSAAPYNAYYSPPHFSYAANLYEKYSGKLKLSDGRYGLTEIFSDMSYNGMPATRTVQNLKAGSIVNMVGDGVPKTENGGIMFVTFMDTKNQLVYYTYWGDKPIMYVLPFNRLQQRMKVAILPEKEIALPIIF